MRLANHWKKLLKEVVGFLSLYHFQATGEALPESMYWLSTHYRVQQSQWDLTVHNRLVRLDKTILALELIFMHLLAQGSYQLCQEEDKEDKGPFLILRLQLCNSVWQIYPETNMRNM